MNNNCLIVIPLYKYNLYDYEIISLKRTISLYSNKDYCNIMFLIPTNFDIPKLLNTYNIKIKYYRYFKFDDFYFTSTKEYNKIMLNQDFYIQLYDIFNYMLICQLDAYVFNDQLEYWMNKDYDYIGGYEGNLNIMGNFLLLQNKYQYSPNVDLNKLILMNGGFSLRKIDYCLNIIDTYENIINNIHLSAENDILEDLLYSACIYKYVNALDAIKFGYTYLLFDQIYQINNFELPFGCHAFHKNVNLFNLVKEYDKLH